MCCRQNKSNQSHSSLPIMATQNETTANIWALTYLDVKYFSGWRFQQLEAAGFSAYLKWANSLAISLTYYNVSQNMPLHCIPQQHIPGTTPQNMVTLGFDFAQS